MPGEGNFGEIVSQDELDRLALLVGEFTYAPHGPNVREAVKEFNQITQDIYHERIKDHPMLRDISYGDFVAVIRGKCRERFRTME